MRTRLEIEQDPKSYERLILEVLLDIRDLLKKAGTQTRARPVTKRKPGRPKKIK